MSGSRSGLSPPSGWWQVGIDVLRSERGDQPRQSCGFGFSRMALSGPRPFCWEGQAMSHDRIPMTREGYDKKKAQLEYMQTTKMIEITKRIATAREMGDLSENAEYHAAREDQGILQAQIDA